MRSLIFSRLVLCAALAAVGTLTANAAEAFCRSTTCVGECARDADGCKTAGLPLFWTSSCVGFSLSRRGSEHIPLSVIREVMQRSVVAWTDIACGSSGTASLAFTALKDVTCDKAEFNPGGANANVVLFQDTKWSYTSLDNTLAKTTVTYDTDTGEILDADLEFNHAFNEFTTGDDVVLYDLQSIATHEFGHFIGLDHTPDFLATMFAGYSEGSTDIRTIEPDDEDAICSVYPPDRVSRCDPQPKGGFTTTCSTSGEEEGCAVTSPGPTQTPELPASVIALLGCAWWWRRNRTSR